MILSLKDICKESLWHLIVLVSVDTVVNRQVLRITVVIDLFYVSGSRCDRRIFITMCLLVADRHVL